jgi:hypothetical protein
MLCVCRRHSRAYSPCFARKSEYSCGKWLPGRKGVSSFGTQCVPKPRPESRQVGFQAGACQYGGGVSFAYTSVAKITAPTLYTGSLTPSTISRGRTQGWN